MAGTTNVGADYGTDTSAASVQVVVVGAGPVGLTAACQLVRRGVDVRIVDKKASPSDKSKALAVHARTLEILDDLGVVETLLEHGTKLDSFSVFQGDRRQLRLSLHSLAGAGTRLGETAYPFALAIEQAKTERALIRFLEENRGRVEWGTEASLVEQNDDRVVVSLTRGTSEEVVRCSYLVACDGPRSPTRDKLGLEFEGFRYPMDMMLADVRLDPATPSDELRMHTAHNDVMVLIPYGSDGRFRVIFDVTGQSDNVKAGTGTDKAGAKTAHEETDHGVEAASVATDKHRPAPTLEEVQEAIDKVMRPKKMVASDPVWTSFYHIHLRLLKKFKCGRVFFAGDAAHIHSPVGGQGMNTGIHDATNLAWKLALVLKGEAHAELLESYEPERRPVAEMILKNTDAATKGAFSSDIRTRAQRSLFLTMQSTFPSLQRPILLGIAELSESYRKSPIVGQGGHGVFARAAENILAFAGRAPVLPGDRAPDAYVKVLTPPVRIRTLQESRRPIPLLFEQKKSVNPTGEERLLKVLDGRSYHLLLLPGLALSHVLKDSLLGLAAEVLAKYGKVVACYWVLPRPTNRSADSSAVGDGAVGVALPTQEESPVGPQVTVLIDTHSKLYSTYGAVGDKIYLVRPDGYVAWRSDEALGEPVLAHLQRLLVCRVQEG